MASLGTHIPKEITDYQERYIGGLTLRQIIALAVAVLCGFLTSTLCLSLFHLTIRQSSYFIMLAALPAGAVGFLRPQNMNFEDYVRMRYRYWQRSKPIPYTTTQQGEHHNGTVRPKAKANLTPGAECTCKYYIPDPAAEKRLVRLARKSIRAARRETKCAIRAAKKAARKEAKSARRRDKGLSLV